MKFKLHDVVTVIGNANDNIPMVVIANGIDGNDWVLLSGNQLILADECNMCYWYERYRYRTKEVKQDKTKSIKNLWGLL